MRDKVKIDGEVITGSEVSRRGVEARLAEERKPAEQHPVAELKRTEATDSGSRPEVQRKRKRWRKPESHV
jgi:hypothetical protein